MIITNKILFTFHIFPAKKKRLVVTVQSCVSNVGDYYNGPPGDLDQEPDEEWVKSRQNEGRAYQEWDEDADVDESGEVLF